MAITSVLDLTNIHKLQINWSTVADTIFDQFNKEQKGNIAVQVIAGYTGINKRYVSDAFKYYDAFGCWPQMDVTRFIQGTKEGPEFWLGLYKAYDRKNLKISYKKILDLILPLI